MGDSTTKQPMAARLAAVCRLAEWSRRGRALRPVFIVGEMRSGTSIVYRVLLRHPSFAPQTFHLTEPKAVHAIATRAALDPAPSPLRSYFYGGEERYEELVAAINSTLPWRRLAVPVARRRRGSVAGFRFALGGIALRAYVTAATEARGCPRLVDKTPGNLPYSRHLLAAVPAAKLLYIVRHPVDTFSSYWRRYRDDPGAPAWAAIPVARFADRWGSNVRTALELASERPDAFRIVSYERFTADPATNFAEVCEFLGEPDHPEALDLWDGSPQWPADPRLMQEIVPATKQWREHVSIEDAAAIEEELVGPMTAIGYERYTTDVAAAR